MPCLITEVGGKKKKKQCTYPVLNLTFHPYTGVLYMAKKKGFTTHLCV